MKKAFAVTLGALTLAAAPYASAQDAAPAPAEQAAPAAASTFTDGDIKTYAGVAAQLSKIQSDAALSETDKQAQMAAAVQASGLEIAKFNAITEASKSDPELQKKIQAATAP